MENGNGGVVAESQSEAGTPGVGQDVPVGGENMEMRDFYVAQAAERDLMVTDNRSSISARRF